jgi:hypothetical protein
MAQPLSTILVKSSDYPGLPQVRINASDFDPQKHELLEGEEIPEIQTLPTAADDDDDDEASGTVPEPTFETVLDTLKVVHRDHPNLPFVIINKKDFDEETHQIYIQTAEEPEAEAGKNSDSINGATVESSTVKSSTGEGIKPEETTSSTGDEKQEIAENIKLEEIVNTDNDGQESDETDEGDEGDESGEDGNTDETQETSTATTTSRRKKAPRT